MEFDIDDYDIDAIKDDLYDYFGTAMSSSLSYAEADLVDLDNKSDYEIIMIAINIGININKYYIGKRY